MIDYGAWGGVRWSISDTGRLVLRPIKSSDYDRTTQHNLISKDLGDQNLGMLPSRQPINSEDYGKLPQGDINHTVLSTVYFPWQLYSSSIKEVFAELGENDMPIKAIGDMKCLFSGLSQVVTARTFSGMNSFSTVEQGKMMGLENIDWSEATSLSHLFSGSIIEDSIYSYLEDHELELINIIQPGITDVSYMFENCTGLRDLIFRQEEPRNDVMYTTGMFSGCTNLYSVDTDIYFDYLIHMSEMFYNCQNLHNVPFLSNSNLSSLTHAQNTFEGCMSLVEIQLGAKYILTLDSEIDEEKTYYEYERGELKIVTDPKEESLHLYFEKTTKAPLNDYSIDYLFSNCWSLEKIYNLDNLDTSNVYGMDGVFACCTDLKELNLSSFDTSNVTSMCEMFNSCQSLTELDLSNFNTSNVTDMSYLFEGCINLITLNISSFRTSNVEYMNNMFKDCQSLTELDLSNFDTSNVELANNMFYSCLGLTELDLSNFTNVGDISFMFYNCINLVKLNISNFNTASMVDMIYVFYNCENLTELNLGNFNTSSAYRMQYMFYNCQNLSFNLTNFDTSHVVNMDYMFYNCKKLENLPANFVIKAAHLQYTFAGCINLKGNIYIDSTEQDAIAYENMFLDINNHIYIIDPYNSLVLKGRSIPRGWYFIINSSPYLHYNAFSTGTPTVGLNSIKRVDSNGIFSPNGTTLSITITAVIFKNNIPSGWIDNFSVEFNDQTITRDIIIDPIEILESNRKAYRINFKIDESVFDAAANKKIAVNHTIKDSV